MQKSMHGRMDVGWDGRDPMSTPDRDINSNELAQPNTIVARKGRRNSTQIKPSKTHLSDKNPSSSRERDSFQRRDGQNAGCQRGELG